MRNLTANASIEDTAPRGSRVREFVTGAEVRTRGGCERTVRILIREGLKPASGQERSVGAENSDRLRKTKEHTRETGVRGTQRTSAVEGTLSISRVAARLKPRRDELLALAIMVSRSIHVPENSPAISDLLDLFHFDHEHDGGHDHGDH